MNEARQAGVVLGHDFAESRHGLVVLHVADVGQVVADELRRALEALLGAHDEDGTRARFAELGDDVPGDALAVLEPRHEDLASREAQPSAARHAWSPSGGATASTQERRVTFAPSAVVTCAST